MKLNITLFVTQTSYTAAAHGVTFRLVTELQTHTKQKNKQFLYVKHNTYVGKGKRKYPEVIV
jgi:hypothetical protein